MLALPRAYMYMYCIVHVHRLGTMNAALSDVQYICSARDEARLSYMYIYFNDCNQAMF